MPEEHCGRLLTRRPVEMRPSDAIPEGSRKPPSLRILTGPYGEVSFTRDPYGEVNFTLGAGPGCGALPAANSAARLISW